MLAKFSNETVTVPKAIVVGLAVEVPESLVDKINARSQPDSQTPTKPPRQRKNEALYSKLLQGKLDHLSQEDRQHIEPVLLKYAHVFHDEDTNDKWACCSRHNFENAFGTATICFGY
jgi:hypothetical protein